MSVSKTDYSTRPGICTSSTHPSNPWTGMLIYETDTSLYKTWSGSAWIDPLPRGVVAYSSITANVGPFTTLANVTGLTITYNFDSTRMYKLSCRFRVSDSVAGDRLIMRLRDTAPNDYAIDDNLSQSGASICFDAWVLLPGLSGSKTFVVSFERSSGTGTVTVLASTANLAWMYLEDLGKA